MKVINSGMWLDTRHETLFLEYWALVHGHCSYGAFSDRRSVSIKKEEWDEKKNNKPCQNIQKGKYTTANFQFLISWHKDWETEVGKKKI